MMRFLGRHPFPVVAWFDKVVAVSFAFPESTLRPLVPAILELDAHDGLGFITVALVWTRRLRPAGFPACLGQDFFLAGYRIFTRLRDPLGRRLRGLKILRSETDRRSMVWFGNLLTRYHYRYVRVSVERSANATRVRTAQPGGKETLDLAFDDQSPGAPLPAASPFADWRSARRFAGPMPFTFSPEADGTCIVVEGTRDSWKPRPISVIHCRVALFEELPLRGAEPILANAFAIEGISYRWELGRLVRPAAPP
jgi:uncharacterized protein YqjF (DUF2071 family)